MLYTDNPDMEYRLSRMGIAPVGTVRHPESRSKATRIPKVRVRHENCTGCNGDGFLTIKFMGETRFPVCPTCDGEGLVPHYY